MPAVPPAAVMRWQCVASSCTGCQAEWRGLLVVLQLSAILVASHHSFLAAPVQVFNELPLEFAAEVNQLMSLKLEGSVG